jgi:hypothetical protein
LGGPLTELFRVFFPPQTDIDEDRWRRRISAAVNTIEARLELISPSLDLSDDALYIGRRMSELAEAGNQDIFDFDWFKKQFPACENRDLTDSLAEMASHNLLVLSYNMNTPFSHVLLNNRFYEIFDLVAFNGQNPRSDAVLVAKTLVESNNSTFDSRDFIAETSWSKRRLNPAAAIVAEFISDGRKNENYGMGFSVNWMFADPTERANLKRFIASTSKS